MFNLTWKELIHCKTTNQPTLHFGVVAIEKGAFGSPETIVDQLTYMKEIYKYIRPKRFVSHLFHWPRYRIVVVIETAT